MKEEFIAAQNLTLHFEDKQPSPNIEGAKEILVKKGDLIPEMFVSGFLLNNRDFISNLKVKDGIPQLTADQEKRYGVKFVIPPIKTFKENVDKEYNKTNEEKLKQKLAYYIKKYKEDGADRFKDWAEKNYGEDIDRRKSPDNIIIQILNKQDGVA